ncbi:putative gibberellin 20-oxidase [Talaromyces proteolyticus]|uniref:Gibberellin 20-oxidase n=1 Tax=Talaromyces proteolyticus TaxID=1131652 RepID=A0AAD4KHM5_9EURO|nr:putative gibberellin 20-oxidase [Talaromyces proteolyticus]KAH8690604.1 putative gibberellin 20-oxidase [Talaromyces proteolyticus]
MSTIFSSLTIVDLAPLQNASGPSISELQQLSSQLHDVFTTTGFAYLVNTPLTFTHADVFGLALEFFNLPLEEKMKLAKQSFHKENHNTYRGYFPTQPTEASDNLKEGFEIGSSQAITTSSKPRQDSTFDLSEPNVWPSEDTYPTSSRQRLEQFYSEMQSLSSALLSLLAMSLGKPPSFFEPYLTHSLSTLRLLHYPPCHTKPSDSPISLDADTPPPEPSDPVKLSCTPHTDSGILTLLHQDSTGGLEVQDSAGKWVPVPYIPESIVVNIGDLMARVSGGRFVATMHRVRAPAARMVMKTDEEDDDAASRTKFGRFSVPFFFEPGEGCVVRSVEEDDAEGVVYGEHMRAKMKTWVEYNSS